MNECLMLIFLQNCDSVCWSIINNHRDDNVWSDYTCLFYQLFENWFVWLKFRVGFQNHHTALSVFVFYNRGIQNFLALFSSRVVVVIIFCTARSIGAFEVHASLLCWDFLTFLFILIILLLKCFILELNRLFLYQLDNLLWRKNIDIHFTSRMI